MTSLNDDFNNLNYDPLAEMNAEVNVSKIHIRIQKRNARKSICTVEGLAIEEAELKAVLKDMKKSFACNGCLIDDATYGKIIQLQGDIRTKAKQMLISKYDIQEDNIIVHGYD